MTFWEHLDELRKVIFRSFAVLIVLMVVFFLCKEIVFDGVVLAPLTDDFFVYRWLNDLLALMGLPALKPFAVTLVNIDLAAQFFTHVRMAFWLAVIIALPFLLYQIWLFVRPALYDREKKAAEAAFSMASLLFYVGLAVGYVIVFPLTLRFLGTYQVSESVANQISLGSYIGMFHRDVPEDEPYHGSGLRAACPGLHAVPDRYYQQTDAKAFQKVRGGDSPCSVRHHYTIGRRIYHDSSGTADIYALRGLHQAVQQ